MKIWPFSKKSDTTSPSTTEPAANTPIPEPAETSARPIYQKPVLRRYDQIDQVKPYGPSEI